jgi:hypothetical protein
MLGVCVLGPSNGKGWLFPGVSLLLLCGTTHCETGLFCRMVEPGQFEPKVQGWLGAVPFPRP